MIPGGTEENGSLLSVVMSMIRFPSSPSDQLVFDALAGQEAFVEVVFDEAHFGDQVGEVRDGQQAAAGQYELCGVGFHRDQFLDILARHEAAAHGLAEFVQNQNVDL